MMNLAWKLLCMAILAGASALAVNKHGAIARARAEQLALLDSQQEAEKLAGENAELAKLRAANVDVKKLEQENHDLPRLRNEVRQLREQAREAEKLRGDNQRLTADRNQAPTGAGSPALPPDFLPRAALADAGLSTPEATVQTFLHAMLQGDLRRAAQCHSMPNDRQMTPEEEAAEGQRLQKESAGFPGYRIAAKKDLAPDEVEIGLQCAPGGVVAPVKLKLISGEWKIE